MGNGQVSGSHGSVSEPNNLLKTEKTQNRGPFSEEEHGHGRPSLVAAVKMRPFPFPLPKDVPLMIRFFPLFALIFFYCIKVL